MSEARRTFKFSTTVYGNKGQSASVGTTYEVHFHHVPNSHFVTITIEPDFEEPTVMHVRDCDITWKALHVAWKWCFRHASDDLHSWMEIGLKPENLHQYCPYNGTPVIPVEKLSTTLGDLVDG